MQQVQKSKLDFPDLIQLLTLKRMESQWMQNMGENLQVIRKGHDISEIPKQDKPAIIIGAGPSVKHEKLSLLRKWTGVVVCCDRMLVPLLKKRVVPHFVTSVDGSPKIAEFYRDALVQKHVHEIKCVLSVQTTHPDVVKALPNDSMFWFTSIWDNPFNQMSVTRIFHHLSNKTMMSSLGNTGAAAWELSRYLHCNPIGLLGIDFAYESLDFSKSTYFETFKILSGGDVQRFLKNYRFATTWAKKKVLTDLMFLTYYKILVPQLACAKVKTFNLGKYSILPADKAEPLSFKKFIKS